MTNLCSLREKACQSADKATKLFELHNQIRGVQTTFISKNETFIQNGDIVGNGNLVAMVTRLPWQPQCYVNNSFVFSPIEVIFGRNLS